MKLIPPIEAPSGAAVREYRDVSWRGLLFAGLCFLCLAGYILMPKGAAISWGAALMPLVLAVFCILLALWRYAGSGNAWLLRSAMDGLYINTGYSDGYPLPPGPSDVFFVPADCVQSIQAVQEVLRLPHRIGATRHHLSSLDIRTRTPVPEKIQDHIRAQQTRFRNAGKSGPYPVRLVAPARLRLSWGWVQPRVRETAEQLSETYRAGPPEEVRYPEWDALAPGQQRVYIDLLWLMGMAVESIFLGRLYYGQSSIRVRQMLAEGNGGYNELSIQHKPETPR